MNERGQEFTCEFTTSTVGEHSIEIVVGEKRLDNVTSKFYTYDASKISVGSIPPGFVGMPVEFESKFKDIKFEFQIHSISSYFNV